MDDQQKVDNLSRELASVREARIDLLPEQGSLIEVIADAMNALEVAFIMLSMEAKRTPPVTPQATFVPVSNPANTQKL